MKNENEFSLVFCLLGGHLLIQFLEIGTCPKPVRSIALANTIPQGDPKGTFGGFDTSGFQNTGHRLLKGRKPACCGNGQLGRNLTTCLHRGLAHGLWRPIGCLSCEADQCFRGLGALGRALPSDGVKSTSWTPSAATDH